MNIRVKKYFRSRDCFWLLFSISLCVFVCARTERKKRDTEMHGCHSNCVIMLVAIMKAMKTGEVRGEDWRKSFNTGA